jgi:MFS family permease
MTVVWKIPLQRAVTRMVPCFIGFFSSMAIMVLELVAGRLVSNNVGSSQYTWVSIICVILAGMSIGNWYGGRLADRYRPSRILWILFFAAALLILFTLPLNSAISALKRALISQVVEHPGGSSQLWGLSVFLMMTIVFFLPATALGAISPVVAQMAIELYPSSGRAVGTVYSFGAVGAVLGVFLTGFVLVSHLSVTSIVLLVAGAMTLLGLLTGLPVFLRALKTGPRALLDVGRPAPAGGAAAAAIEAASWRERWTRNKPNLVVFMTSMCLMAIEVVAGRLVARNVGNSIYSWTAVIGVIFAGMSIGNYLGGRLSARYRPEAVLGQLFLLASMLCTLLLWSYNLLGEVYELDSWPRAGYDLRARFHLDESSLSALRDDKIPEPVVSKLRALRGSFFDTETALSERLATVLSADELRTHALPILRRTVLSGRAFQGLRAEGVPDAVLWKLHVLRKKWRVSETVFSERLKEVLTEDELDKHKAAILRHAKVDTVFQFPMRLILLVFLVFFPPAMGLGLISPVIAQMAIDRGRSSGRAVGNVYAWGAWGSILGTFLCGFYLLSALGSYPIIAAAALILVLLGILVAAPRLLQCLWLVLLIPLLLPVFHQIRQPTALDPHPEAVSQSNAGSSWTGEIWDKLPSLIGSKLQVRDPDLSEKTVESDYQFIKVMARARKGGDEKLLDVRTLSLDYLIHGYVAVKMPEASQTFNFENAVFDATHFEYDYARPYAVVTARAFRSRFGRQGDPLTLPTLRSLFIGGGSYTFPRYLVEMYKGEAYTVAPGDTLSSVVEKVYGTLSATQGKAIRARLHKYNERVLGDAAPEALPSGAAMWIPSLADVAELDPMVTEVNYARLKLKRPEEDPRILTWNYDARNFIESAAAAGWKYDVIYGDAFNHYSVPYHLTTREFNESVKAVLTPGGVYIVNVVELYETSRFMSAYVNTLRQTFRYVYVLGEKDKTERTSRTTFVVAASETPLPLEFLGAYDEEVMELVKKRDLKELTAKLGESDPGGLALLERRLRSDRSGAVYQDLAALKRLDMRVLGVPEDGFAAAEKNWDRKLRIRRYISFSQEEIQRIVVDRGRPREILGQRPPEFRLSEESFEALRREGVPGEISEKLRPIQGDRFATVEAWIDRLAGLLSREELTKYQAQISEHARIEAPYRGPPLVLTDDHAPVDDLLSPLFEDE